jgi:exopolysaccharide biosynthesis polyprenyl glycosylphosphotransferase
LLFKAGPMMADGAHFPGLKAAAQAGQDRRGPMRPAQLVSARSRFSGRLLAHLFMAADALGLIAAATGFLIAHQAIRPDALLGAMLAFGFLLGAGAYDMTRRESGPRHVLKAAVAVAAGLAIPMAARGALAGPDLAWWAGVTAMAAALHLAWFQIVARLRAAGRLTPNVLVVGATASAERLIRWALREPGSINVIGVFDDRRDRIGPQIAGVPILGGLADLVEHRTLPYVDRIVITVPAQASARIAQLTALLETVPNPITLLLDDDDAPAGVDQSRAYERLANFGLQQIAGRSRSSVGRIAKRGFDFGVASVAALLLAPVFLGIALAIRLDSPGPVLFRQKRHGFLNEEFMVFKFRSMRAETTDHQSRQQVTANDDRVTRVGRFIRKTSLDELPQLFNVIRGEMSLVGPRPHAIGMLVQGEDATRLLKTYAHRHRIKPGLTGLAAIRGSRGPVDTPEDVRDRVALDLEYIERQSFWLDLSIALRTLPCLLGDSAAVR